MVSVNFVPLTEGKTNLPVDIGNGYRTISFI